MQRPRCDSYSVGAALAFWLVVLLTVFPLVAAKVAGAQELPYGQGLLWRVEKPNQAPSVIFGTMHVTDAEVLDLPPAVAAALASADRMVGELVMTEAVERRMGEAMLLSDGRSLQAVLGPRRFEAVVQAGARYGFTPESLDRMAPWAVLTILSISPAEFARSAAGTEALDLALQSEARRREIPIYGLETLDEQLAIFTGMPEADQIALLELTVAENAQIDWWFEQIRQAYLTRDNARIFGIMKAQSAGSNPALIESFEDRLIGSRNIRMVARMAVHLQAGKAFVAIGALHLPGENGVLARLARQGYRISRLY